jgi:hypothetical protein
MKTLRAICKIIFGPFLNEQGQLSGVKAIFVFAAVLAGAWLLRDLHAGRPLEQYQTALLTVLLVIGLINRIGARGFKLKLSQEGAEIETKGRGDNDQD